MDIAAIASFLEEMRDQNTGGCRSVPDGIVTLYGTCYAILTSHYLGIRQDPGEETLRFILDCQDAESGYFIGPELREWTPEPSCWHDRTHLLMHLACATLPALYQFGSKPRFKLRFAHPFVSTNYLVEWLDRRKLSEPWLEGNNLLFVGQLLVFLRDQERIDRAQDALNLWFAWLEKNVDPFTGLWGTNHGASPFAAAYGGYHQLLLYYHEGHRLLHPERLVDTVLSLQHPDGGFTEYRGGGACADVDCVDILVNLYKLQNYRRPDIRWALRRCMWHIQGLQNLDGGFPDRRDLPGSHMGIPATVTTAVGGSSMFATWFRVHTLALIAEILTDEPELNRLAFQFSSTLSMGWHQTWDKAEHRINAFQRGREAVSTCRWAVRLLPFACRRASARLRRFFG